MTQQQDHQDDLDPAGFAAAIGEARQRLLDYVTRCSDRDWAAAPVPGDPRPVGVILDHVAHSYEYLAGWIGGILAGRPPEVSADLVDAMNAEHAAGAAGLSQAQVAAHLRASGDQLIALTAGLHPGQLDLDGQRVRRLAQIAARHADGHRTEIEAALRPSG
jgi:DinB superfamily